MEFNSSVINCMQTKVEYGKEGGSVWKTNAIHPG